MKLELKFQDDFFFWGGDMLGEETFSKNYQKYFKISVIFMNIFGFF